MERKNRINTASKATCIGSRFFSLIYINTIRLDGCLYALWLLLRAVPFFESSVVCSAFEAIRKEIDKVQVSEKLAEELDRKLFFVSSSLNKNTAGFYSYMDKRFLYGSSKRPPTYAPDDWVVVKDGEPLLTRTNNQVEVWHRGLKVCFLMRSQ